LETPTNKVAAQYNYAEAAKQFYDYRVMGRKLADDIENLRRNYL
jgi:hypothetical protein